MFRIVLRSANLKKIVCAQSITELIENGCRKFGIQPQNVTLETRDGYEITDDDGFKFCQTKDDEIIFIENW